MLRQRSTRPGDLTLRAGGVLLLVLGALLMRELFHAAHGAGPHDASLAELVAAAVAFLSLSGGAVLALLGRHIFDRVEVSVRWRQAPAARPNPNSLSRDELLSRLNLEQPGLIGSRRPPARASHRAR